MLNVIELIVIVGLCLVLIYVLVRLQRSNTDFRNLGELFDLQLRHSRVLSDEVDQLEVARENLWISNRNLTAQRTDLEVKLMKAETEVHNLRKLADAYYGRLWTTEVELGNRDRSIEMLSDECDRITVRNAQLMLGATIIDRGE